MTSGFAQNHLSEIQVNSKIKEGWPLIIDSNSLAFRIGIRNKTLWSNIRLINSGKEGYKKSDGTHIQAYKCFAIKDYYPDGRLKKKRFIQEPNERLKYIHKSLNGLFSSVKLPKPVTAYVKGLPFVMGAAQHVRPTHWLPEKLGSQEEADLFRKLHDDRRYVCVNRNKVSHDPKSEEGFFFHQPIVEIHLDIKNFFNSINASWIRHFFFKGVGYNHTVSGLLATLCSVKMKDRRFLPQGSPLSGSLANLVAYQRFGEAIQQLLDSHSPDWVWTIYSDDIHLSHPDNTITEEDVQKMKAAVSQIIIDAGFVINDKKTRVLRSKYDRIKILGYIVNEKLNLPKELLDNTEFYIHVGKKYGWDSLCTRLEATSGEMVIQKIRGILQHIKSGRPDKFEELNADFQEALKAKPSATGEAYVLTGEEIDDTHDADRAMSAEVMNGSF